ncbi:MAG: DUF5011 domain-containing protein [Oscillospiraceae bacterium]|jgi:hypothetical protein|nr:DUF5011 domain-containing protein [Oscillospiraceae bacterium]
MKPQIKKRRICRAAVISCAAVFIFAAAFSAYVFFLTDKLAEDTPQIEYGQPLPDSAAWFSRINREYIIANADEINTAIPGEYRVVLQSGGKTRESVLTVLDKTPPLITAKPVFALVGETPAPGDFVDSADDVSAVSYTFTEQPDTSRPGSGTAHITALDAHGNETAVTAEYTVISATQTVKYNCEDSPEFSLDDVTDDFGKSQLRTVSAPESDELALPGEYEAVLDYGGRTIKCTIIVLDTTPPAAKPKNLTVYEGKKPGAIDFCTNIKDASPVTAAFSSEPDWEHFGSQRVTVVLTDGYGNTAELSANLTVRRDNVAPKILGTRTLSIMKGEKIAYKKGVIIRDNSGETLDFSVDSSGVDSGTPGRYSATYHAEDLAGNVTEITRTVIVGDIDVSLVDEYIDAAIAELALTGNETGDELLRAVYDYVRGYLKFASGFSEDGLYQLAYNAFKTGKADCRGYLAMSSVLFDRLGIENREVHTGSHKWNMVKIDGKWWFYDATERYWSNGQTYKFGRRKAEQLSKEHAERLELEKPFYYVYDTVLYPNVEQ